jgi:hypothetical protein
MSDFFPKLVSIYISHHEELFTFIAIVVNFTIQATGSSASGNCANLHTVGNMLSLISVWGSS